MSCCRAFQPSAIQPASFTPTPRRPASRPSPRCSIVVCCCGSGARNCAHCPLSGRWCLSAKPSSPPGRPLYFTRLQLSVASLPTQTPHDCCPLSPRLRKQLPLLCAHPPPLPTSCACCSSLSSSLSRLPASAPGFACLAARALTESPHPLVW